MNDHTFYRERKHFCQYHLQFFSTKSLIKDGFKINGKQKIIMPLKK